jgi:hypothetical protein
MRLGIAAVVATAIAAALLPRAALAQQEPEAVFADFHRAVRSGDVAGVSRSTAEPGASELRRLAPDTAKSMVEGMKGRLPPLYTVVGRDAGTDANRATLRATGSVTGTDGAKETLFGTITFVRQRGEWKVEQSNWDTTPHPETAATVKSTPTQAAPLAPKSVAARAAAAPPEPKAVPARTATPVPPKSSPPVVGSMDAAPERKFGQQKPPCEFKPVMTAEDLERCK